MAVAILLFFFLLLLVLLPHFLAWFSKKPAHHSTAQHSVRAASVLPSMTVSNEAATMVHE